MARHKNDSIHNLQVYKTAPFDTGDKVRILEKKANNVKGGGKLRFIHS
jgi:hypothetical protein